MYTNAGECGSCEGLMQSGEAGDIGDRGSSVGEPEPIPILRSSTGLELRRPLLLLLLLLPPPLLLLLLLRALVCWCCGRGYCMCDCMCDSPSSSSC